MKNLFQVDEYPELVPDELTVGSNWLWKRSDISKAYPTESYSLQFRFVEQADSNLTAEIDAIAIDGVFVVRETDTGVFDPGYYRWQAWVTQTSDSAVLLVDEGFLTIHPETGASPGYAYRVLKAIQATIEGTASVTQSRVEIGGRILENRTIKELMELEREFTARWNEEKKAIERKSGRTSGKRTLVKMRA